MSVKVLQINFKFNIPSADLKNGLAPFVKDIAAVSGLRWKVWIMNEQENEAGGIYLFDDEDSIQAYQTNPGKYEEAAAYFSKFMTEFFDIEGYYYDFRTWMTIE